MFPIANQYGYSNSYGWSGPKYSFNDTLAIAYHSLANSSGAYLPQSYFSNAYGSGTYPKSTPDPAYASLYADNVSVASGSWENPQAYSAYTYGEGIGNAGGFVNSWGSNMPPVSGGYAPPEDLYSWNNDSPKDDKPHKRHRRERPDKPDQPDEPSKPRRSVTGSIIGDPVFNGADGEKYKIAGDAGKIYNLMSDHNVQVNGKVEKLRNGNIGYREMGFVVNGGKEIKVSFDANDKMTVKVKEGNKERTLTSEETTDDYTWSPPEPGRNWPKLTIKAAGGQEGERWEFDVTYKATLAGSKNGEKSRFLNLGIRGENIISNEYTTTGLWGHSFDGTKNDVDYKSGVGAGGVLRNSNGDVLGKNASVQAYNAALKGYEMSSLTDTSGGWSMY